MVSPSSGLRPYNSPLKLTGAQRNVRPLAAGSLWSLLCASMPSAVGHPASWRELWFFRPVAYGPMEFAATTCAADVSDENAGVWIAIAPISARPEQRLLDLDELGAGFAKIEYRRQYPPALCVRNASVQHRPGELAADLQRELLSVPLVDTVCSGFS